MTRIIQTISCAFLLAMALTTTAAAHEFIVKPVQFQVQKGAELPFSVLSAHAFMISEEMEPLSLCETALFEGGSTTPAALNANETLMTLDGRIKPTKDGVCILAGHRKGAIWTKTTKGWKQASKKGLTGVIKSGKYEKFSKSLITVGTGGNGWNKTLGQKLEIVPLSNPASVRPGQDLEVKFLFDGKPLSPEAVMATYDGFTTTENSYAYFTEPYGEGLAKIRISNPGVWMVRVQHTEPGDGENYDSHVLRAVLVFEVK